MNEYTVAAYVIGCGVLWGYGAMVWWGLRGRR